jgi:hypothetical protein
VTAALALRLTGAGQTGQDYGVLALSLVTQLEQAGAWLIRTLRYLDENRGDLVSAVGLFV